MDPGLGLRMVALVVVGAFLGVPARAQAKATAGRFVVSADGKTVFDKRTQLTWQRSTPPTGGKQNNGLYSWDDAKQSCTANAMGLPGAGWRLPTVRELLGIVDRRRKPPPALDTDAFLNQPGPDWVYWAGTPLQYAPATHAWYVHFFSGTSAAMEKFSALRVRCVR